MFFANYLHAQALYNILQVEPGILESVFGVILALLIITAPIPIKPAMSKDTSSSTPKDIAAEKPNADHNTGITITYRGGLFASRRAPIVKIVVGQGRPKVGVLG